MRENSRANGLGRQLESGGTWVFLQLLIETCMPGPPVRHTEPELPEWSCPCSRSFRVICIFTKVKRKTWPILSLETSQDVTLCKLHHSEASQTKGRQLLC